MILYVESSAVLAWLLDEEPADQIRSALSDAELVLTSDLTLIECERGLIHATARQRISESDARFRSSRLRRAAHHWICLSLEPGIAERAMAPFPGEPIRTPDALHLAFTLAARTLVGGTRILTLDGRIREAAAALGVEVHPEADRPV